PPLRLVARHEVSARGSRFVLFVGVLAAVGVAARLVFWYWRLAGLNADEARLAVLDTGWAEVRREAARQETWRAWGRPGGRTGGVSFWSWLGAVVPVVTAVILATVGIGFVLGVVWFVFTSW